jgi:glycosyltransferase involved in cell wall biosynthesis
MLDISVVICTYNCSNILADCLRNIAQQDMPPELYEIIVIDNNSTDNTKEVIKQIISEYRSHNWHYIFEPHQGLSLARNRGLLEAKGSIIVYVDDDAFVKPAWLRCLVKPFEEPDVFAVGGRIDLVFPYAPPKWLGDHFRGGLSEYRPMSDEVYNVTHIFQLPFGANMAFRKEGLLLVGGFDTELGRCGGQLLGGEETKLLAKIFNFGWKIVIQPQAVVEHMVPHKRMEKSYFYKLEKASLSQHLRFIKSLSFIPKIFFAIYFLVELILDALRFALKMIAFPKDERRFIMTFKLYRTYYKMMFTTNCIFNRREDKMEILN